MPHVHNGLHFFQRVQDAYRKALGETGPGFNGIERAGETITPVIDLWSLPEWSLPRGEVLFSRKTVVAAGGAGVFSSVELINAAGSGVLAVVRAIRSAGNGVDVSIDSGAALGAVATTRGQPNDGRFSSVGTVSTLTVVTGNLVAGAANAQDIVLGTVSGVESRYPYILSPGRKLFLIAAAANQAITVSLLWTERRANDIELAAMDR